MITVTRYHDFCAGHRVFGHEGHCAHAHGHGYRIFFTVTADALDTVGRVLDFGSIKTRLCQWLEDNWDHKFLLWAEDPWAEQFTGIDPNGVVLLPVNPTAENMAAHLLHVVGPKQLAGTGCVLLSVTVEETRKCSAYAAIDSYTVKGA